MIRRRGTPRIVAVCITTSHLAVASRTQHQLRRGDDVVISTSISRASRASPRSPSRPRADRARARRLDACQLSLVPRSRETPHIASTLALGRPRRDMGHRRSNSAGSRGFSRASSARASSGARKSFRAGSAGTAPWKSARTLARANARHVTTGRARAPRPVNVYDNAHSRARSSRTKRLRRGVKASRERRIIASSTRRITRTWAWLKVRLRMDETCAMGVASRRTRPVTAPPRRAKTGGTAWTSSICTRRIIKLSRARRNCTTPRK